MIQLLRQNYQTYVNTALDRPERHWFRLSAFGALAIVFAIFSPESVSGVYSVMATGVTVLTGFTFTALFSDHALASSGLPEPKTENDRHDLVRLKTLSENFRHRSSFFIALSIIEIVLLAAASFDFVVPERLQSWLAGLTWAQTISSSRAFDFLQELLPIFATAFAFLVNFLYLECLYTFYRMAETMLAILDIRRSYLNTED